jgi:hypothetical protein
VAVDPVKDDGINPWSLQTLKERIKKGFQKSSVIPPNYKQALSESFVNLGESLQDVQHKVHVYHGEADPRMAQTCFEHTDGGNSDRTIVITKDSDLLAYCSTDAVLSRTPRTGGLSCTISPRS